MKKGILFTLVVALLAVPVMFQTATAQTPTSSSPIVHQHLVSEYNLLTAKALSTSTNDTTATKTMFSKGANHYGDVNHLAGASIRVGGNQAHDSVHALIYLQYGKITGGTAKLDFSTVLLDSLTLTKNYAVVSLANYLFEKEVRLIIAGSGTGIGVNATVTAVFGGAGVPDIEEINPVIVQ